MIELPICVDMTLDENLQEYDMSVISLEEEVNLDNSTVINTIIYTSPLYEGEYNVTPLAASEVVLPTKDKRCDDDITVLKIPRHSTSNEYGTTFYIAEV